MTDDQDRADADLWFKQLVSMLAKRRLPTLTQPRFATAGEFMYMYKESETKAAFKHKSSNHWLYIDILPDGAYLEYQQGATFDWVVIPEEMVKTLAHDIGEAMLKKYGEFRGADGVADYYGFLQETINSCMEKYEA